MSNDKNLYQLLGAYDNLNEPTPLINTTPAILGVVLALKVTTLLCVSLRLYTRFRVVRSPGWDDAFLVLAMLSTTIGTVCICVATRFGMGQHVLHLSPENLTNYLRTFYVANASYCMSTTFIKISLLFQYLRIFEKGTALHRTCKILAAFTGLWGLAYSLLGWIPCVPVHMFWDRTPADNPVCFAFGSLMPEQFAATFESHTAINMLLDLIVLAIPVSLWFRPDTSAKTRKALLALLFMGGVVNFVSIWRLVTILEHRAATYPTFDPTWYAPISIVLAAAEVESAMVCASVPVFWPMLRDSFLGSIFVTKEVEVTFEQRYGSDERLENYELQKGLARADSEASLQPTRTKTKILDDK